MISQLCLITSDYQNIQDEIKQHFTVIDVREDQGSEEEDTDTKPWFRQSP